ncbi:DUF397 domain-containing protein [Streptomyces sp. A3M-1-3]|uniref:DUF397 domain-containing protein n=1 Tax=Streptomyces sp. A3M-1-3 TaxID=2962044 RepID=UPI0020B68D4D|nr:DUF397 domain-containing protein [Streptomyces sp. A3M-1-3]MCP3816580.1 DUF397 domain-containing protein [Streptomyces sp. A3M-1-3]
MSTTELAWFKSSYSSSGDGDCIEVALSWRKSSHSSDFEDACVEVASCPDTVHVRDSKVPTGPQLTLTSVTWACFLPYAAQA